MEGDQMDCSTNTAGLAVCSTAGRTEMRVRLTGVVSIGGPLAHARITVMDRVGVRRESMTAADGSYHVDVGGMSPPLLVSAVETGKHCDPENRGDDPRPWAQTLTALVASLDADGASVANVNALSDMIVSDVARSLGLLGPQPLVLRGHCAGVTAGRVREATAAILSPVEAALRAAGVATEAFDPVTTPMRADGSGLDAVLRLLIPRRGYDNNSGAPSASFLLDADYRYVGKLDARSETEALDFAHAREAKNRIEDTAWTRVLIVGDSTVSTYERARLPRMGWGQVFESLFDPAQRIKVINCAKSGRSSRSFLKQGYYAQASRFLRPGDYVFIHHGHNDQNCDAALEVRGAADVAYQATYPNDAAGRPQYPSGMPWLSFQHSLERYITDARQRGAIPVLLTPTTRVWNAARQVGFPVVPNHFTSPHAQRAYAFTGDYAQTVRDTARTNRVPLLDIEAATIAFANAHAADWQDYWLAADPAEYPWYVEQAAGTRAQPDTTHFQARGAAVVAGMVADGIRSVPELAKLAAALRADRHDN